MPRVRSRFSKNSKYFLTQAQFLTVYYFCHNYPEWVKEHDEGAGLTRGGEEGGGGSGISDPTSAKAIRLADLYEKIELIRQTAYDAEPLLHPYLLYYVTHEDMTYDKIKAKGLPCERKMFYDRRRKFYYNLARKMNVS